MKKDILKSIFKTDKPIIGMAHFKALPGSPLYDDNKGISDILKAIEKEIINLQQGGIDAIMFGNENDRPYLTNVNAITTASFSYLIGKVSDMIKIPFGVDVLFDSKATLTVAKAVGCNFVREVFTGTYVGDLGLWVTNCGETMRYRDRIKANHIITMFNINAEFVNSIDKRPLENVAKSVVFSSLPDILLVSGNITGEKTDLSIIEKIKKVLPDTPVFANTGVDIHNVSEVLKVADGAIVGTSLKIDGITWNPIDKIRVIELMKKVKEIRKL